MFRAFAVGVLVLLCIGLWARQQSPSSSNQASQNASPSNSGAQQSPGPDSPPQPVKTQSPNLSPPRSDHVDASALGDQVGESSSKNTQIDASPPENDARTHPQSAEAMTDAGAESGAGPDIGEFHPWDPHKAAKDVEVGDFYFKRKNYRAAEDRYREALYYKDNDAIATFRLAVCLEKLQRPEDARAEYESYLRILPHGPQAEEARKSIERLKNAGAKSEKK